LALALEPLLALMMLTMGTQPVTTGMGHEDLLFAGQAVRLHPGAQRSAAVFHGGQGLTLFRLQPVAVLSQKGGFELLDEGG
jgi:hypothetical protein